MISLAECSVLVPMIVNYIKAVNIQVNLHVNFAYCYMVTFIATFIVI